MIGKYILINENSPSEVCSFRGGYRLYLTDGKRCKVCTLIKKSRETTAGKRKINFMGELEPMQCEVSLDNITICGSPSDYVFKNLEINPLVLEGWTTLKQQYHYNFPLVNGGFIQIKHPSDWYKERRTKCKMCNGTGIKKESHCKHGKAYCRQCHGNKRPKEPCEKCGGLGGKIHVNENGIRIEFNPNKYKTPEAEKAMMDVLKNCWNPHVTRRDVAFDFYEEELSNYKVLDGSSRQKRLYLDRKGQFETIYIGSSDSDLQIRIYNKALEQEKADMTWWRVEAQMRRKYADTFYFNPFTSLRIKRNLDFEKYDWETRAKLEYLVEHPEAFATMSKHSKLKYKKMLMEDVESVELKIEDMFQESSQILYEELESWLSLSRNSNRTHRGNMSMPDTILKSEIKHIREIIPLENGIRRELRGL